MFGSTVRRGTEDDWMASSGTKSLTSQNPSQSPSNPHGRRLRLTKQALNQCELLLGLVRKLPLSLRRVRQGQSDEDMAVLNLGIVSLLNHPVSTANHR